MLNGPFWDRLTKPTWNTFYVNFFSINTLTNLGHFYKKKFSQLKKNLTIRKKISHNYKKNLTTIKNFHKYKKNSHNYKKKISTLLKNLKTIKKTPQNYKKNQNHKKFSAMKKKILSGYSIKW